MGLNMNIGKIPWWLKIVIKIALSKIPNKEVILRKFVFRWGNMDVPQDAYATYMKHYTMVKELMDIKDKVVLELGNGDSLLSSIFFYSLGVKKIYLVDAGSYAKAEIDVYYFFIELLLKDIEDENISIKLRELKECKTVGAIMKKVNAKYMTEGLKSLREIQDESVDFVFSNAVLEHIYLDELESEIKELYRISSKGSYHSHIIDYKDHLAKSIYSLKFSEKVWESRLFRESGFYTNRLRHEEVCEILKSVDYKIIVEKIRIFPKEKNIYRIKVNKKFIGRKDINIQSASLICERC